MRGVPALRQAPLVLIPFLLVACNLVIKIEQPSLELDAKAIYQTGSNLQITYKFIADEPVLRCRYALNRSEVRLLAGVRGPLYSGVPDTLEFSLPDDGNYVLQLVGQVERSGTFVDMASLSQNVSFSIDSDPPEAPIIGMVEGGRYGPTDQILLNHAEWETAGTSPVKLRYNFDAGPFDPGALEVSRQAGGVPIGFPAAIVGPGLHTLQVTAIDEAGNYLPTPASKQFSFLVIQSAIDYATGGNRSEIGKLANITIAGFSFGDSDNVRLYDCFGAEAPYFGSPIISQTSITVTFDLRNIVSFAPGMGHIEIVTASPNVSTTTIPFELFVP